MKRKNLIIIIVAVVAISLLGFFYYKKATRTSNTIRIGALLPLTGGGANYGKSLKQGIDLAVDEVNRAGGVNGERVEIIYEDSQSDPKTGVSGFNKLVGVDKVPVVLGSLSSVILAVQPIADEKRVVLINSSAISPKICEKADNFLFSLMVNGATEARFAANELARQYRAQPIAILYSNNSSGVDTKDAFTRQVVSTGGTVVSAEGYELNATDFKPQLLKIKNSNARIGYLIAFSSQEFANILIQSKEIGMSLQWYSYSGIETRETLDLAKNAADGVIYSYPQYNPADALFDSFQDKYRSSYHTWADIYTVTSFDAIKLLSQVMSKSGTSSEQLQQGLRSQKGYKGIFGDVQFTEKQCVEPPLMWKIIKDGKYRLNP